MKTKSMTLLVVLALLVTLFQAGIVLAKGKPPVETTNNLSFPVIWSEGVKMTLAGTMLNASLAVPYDVTRDGLITDADMLACGGTLAYAYAQKTTGNTWQAQNVDAVGPVYVSEIDWGDSLESSDFKVRRPIRVELTLYKLLDNPMTGYNMVMLANPSSPDEVQGACATANPGDNSNVLTYSGTEASVYSPNGKIVIQLLGGTREEVLPGDLIWDGTKWVDGNPDDPTTAGNPINVSFAGELNVGGKVIYGLSTGGWKPTTAGDYRITFYLPLDKNAQLRDATVRASAEETITIEAEGTGGGTAVVDGEKNLTYIDIRVAPR
jgi:hypothetical protein